MRGTASLGVVCAMLLSGAAEARPRMAIMPVDTIGVPAPRGERLRAALVEALEEAGVAIVVSRAEVDAALPADPDARAKCADDSGCIEGVARQVKATLALSVTLGGMGDTHLVRLRLFDVERGVAAREIRETIIGQERVLIEQTRALALRMTRDPPTPWYAKWWAWAAIGAGITASVAIPLVIRDSGGDDGFLDLGPLGPFDR